MFAKSVSTIAFRAFQFLSWNITAVSLTKLTTCSFLFIKDVVELHSRNYIHRYSQYCIQYTLSFHSRFFTTLGDISVISTVLAIREGFSTNNYVTNVMEFLLVNVTSVTLERA